MTTKGRQLEQDAETHCSVCDSCGKESGTITREVDDSLFELCQLCDPYTDFSLTATARSVVVDAQETRDEYRTIARDIDPEYSNMKNYYEGMADGAEKVAKQLTRLTGAITNAD